MKNKIFSKLWFKDLFYFFIKELLWSNIPVVTILIFSGISFHFFPEKWWTISLIGSAVIVVLFFILTYISEKKKAKHR
ncbi:hypothetical protein [Xenorhabdus griffiniae]|uniref:Uncharacterized protein n=1 Tax=Xenorhabdus griffiniae TaxID=351672 RepID=A0ABY9XKA4_9GAMM|nr:hypothetical protein [Xenorhabdus griffiniae]MBD1229196.1 hypothetical protein [Xenorhabdus griffiniae]MBE8587670.1 hypothetical protein [Xenorhabdus griffiniae]WMV73317.1 hypothetical protein QL128_04575 [Xenorhabdus griffiniae]WNH02996.1 hypothetical protein QL112_004580 [Xenorhabdus griffiniae]